MGLQDKLIPKGYVKLVHEAINWYTVLEEYLEIMPLTRDEKVNIKMVITIKIERAIDTRDKKAYKDIKKRMKKMKNEVLEREKRDGARYEECDEDAILSLANKIFKRNALNGDL